VIISEKPTVRDKPRIAQIPQMIAGKWLNFGEGQRFALAIGSTNRFVLVLDL
jgi:hypothetical protein